MQRLGLNHGSYQGERIDIRGVLQDIVDTARTRGWDVKSFHRAGDLDWWTLRREPRQRTGRSFRLYLSAGIHGDEPAGPLTMLHLLRAEDWPAGWDITLVPCLNPSGFLSNRRENPDGLDLNRDYLRPRSAEIRAHVAWLEQQADYELCVCLHEDWEAHGFYLYELNPDCRPSLAEPIIQDVAPVCPIDLSTIIEGRAAAGGIIRPSLDPALRPQWPESFWLLNYKTRLAYTLEAPSDFALGIRVNALVAAVKSILKVQALPAAMPPNPAVP